MKNKETNMQQPLESGIHDTSTHCPCVPFNLLGLTVPENENCDENF